MTREEFVKGYAKRSNKSAEWAPLGFMQGGSMVFIALPCACGEEGCEGWAMVSNEHVLDHLFFRVPEPLRSAYREVTADADIAA